jgi:hypothetical protein
MTWLRAHRIPLAASLVALIVLCAVAGERLRRRSTDPHFVVQADAWLHGRLDIDPWPPGADDPAKLEEVELDDGSHVRGRRLQSRPTFRVAGGGEIPIARVTKSIRTIAYNSFPPFPSVLMIPQVLIHGARANDVGTTVFLAALIPFAFLALMRRLREAGLSTRTTSDELWLAAFLTFGTVLFFSSVQGRVWFTAHVVGVLLAVLFLWATVEARHPLAAGLFLGCAVATRTPMLFMAPLFLWELRRVGWSWRRAIYYGAPLAAVGVVLAAYNYARFHEFAEFGHSYLAVKQQLQMEHYGLFSPHYLGRNLAVAFTLLPEVTAQRPWISISGHGLALWLTSPALVVLLWPREKNAWHRPLWLTVAAVAVWSLCYQNSGWVQFGYRFSLDYIVLLAVLLAIGGRRIPRTLIVLGILVNLFGAVTFARLGQFYRTDNGTYETVVPH